MNIKDIENHGFIKLIEFALENKSFSKKQACEFSGLRERQFDFSRDKIFVLSGYQEQNLSASEIQDWELSPESYFNYLQYVGFKHAVKVSRRAHYTAITAIAISVTLAVVSIIVSVGTSGACT